MKKLFIFTLLAITTRLCFAQITFSGQLKNSESMTPIESAYILLKNSENSYSAYSTNNGSFKIENVVIGQYTISISHIGYNVLVEPVSIEAGSHEMYLLDQDMEFIEAAIISSVRAKKTTPTTFTNITKKEIELLDQGKDFPFILNMTPSTVVSSDAGNGVGYTGIRVRGIDPTRVNVTINGIPLNDAESQGTYWVDLPDIASSTESVQVQRGIGTSTNGAGAFGASVNIRTNIIPEQKATAVSLGLGSFNTFRSTFSYSSGKLKKDWAYQLRGSLIESDGFIDRASSNLKSFNFAAAKYWDKSVLKTNILLGHERTYQGWYGVPQPKFSNNTAELNRYTNQLGIGGADLENLQSSNSKTFNHYTYENEVDNYNQNHYQLFYDYNPLPYLKINTAAYLTTGKGYFEQFRPDDDFADYDMPNKIIGTDTFTSGDLVRRRWLDNTLKGVLASAHFQKSNFDITAGGGFSTYAGQHFGEVIATEYTGYEDLDFIYYDNNAVKTDGNFFVKKSYNWKNIIPFIDLQFRFINYEFEGLNDTLGFAQQEVNYTFFNPKMGLTYIYQNNTFYAVWAQANREPVRKDFRENKPTDWPDHEQLSNIEVGYRYSNERKKFGLNLYSMDYANQLVLTGAVNDVGDAIRTNVDESFRRGIETEFQYPLTSKLQLGGNATFSQNKIARFTEYVAEWTDPWGVVTQEYSNTDISFSPNVIVAGIIGYQPNKNITFNLQSKYVDKQYLDNTQNKSRMLDAFTTVDASVNYKNETLKGMKRFSASLYMNNILNNYYAPNGYTFSGYVNGDRADFNYLYPMAGFNWMLKLSLIL
jgi:iron complex outermembrane receptor protein